MTVVYTAHYLENLLADQAVSLMEAQSQLEEAKAEVEKISKRMAEIGSSDVTHPDKLVQSRLQKEYFTLEQRMEKYLNALTLSDEHQEVCGFICCCCLAPPFCYHCYWALDVFLFLFLLF